MNAPSYLTEAYLIRQSDPRWRELDRMSLLAKNVFNVANYLIRQAFFADRDHNSTHDQQRRTWVKMLNFIHLKETLRREYPDDYSALPKRVSETCIKAVISLWRGYDAAWFDWCKHPQKYRGEPHIPRYKKSGDMGRAQILWNQEAIGKRAYHQDGVLVLSGCDVTLEVGSHVYDQIRHVENLKPDAPVNVYDRIATVSVLPRNDHYLVTMTYQIKPAPNEQLDRELALGIDLGVNNLMAITSNKAGFEPILVNGRPVKSINQYFNKKRAKLQSMLPQDHYSSQRLQRLNRIRSRRMKDYLHSASKWVVDLAVAENVGVVVIGQNKNWKQGAAMGKRNNQTFLNIPHSRLIDMIAYKAQLAGIKVIRQEESYTSKCSFLDSETIQKHDEYMGKRIKRGLFRTRDGRLINADVNASYNIIKKAIPNAFANGIEDVAVHPTLISV